LRTSNKYICKESEAVHGTSLLELLKTFEHTSVEQ